MHYAVALAPAAWRQVRRRPREVQVKLTAAIEDLGTNPRPRGVVKLEATLHLYRVRVGDYRVIYQISDREASVLVVKIGHRGSVYGKKGS